MKLKKMVIAASSAAMLVMAAVPAHAEAYFIGGEWYYFSLNFKTLLAKITGKDLKTDTFVGAEVKITGSEVQCANPQGKLSTPGVGPKGVVYGTSPRIDASNLLSKSDNKVTGNIYTTTATVLDLVPEQDRLTPPTDLCKDPQGVATWVPTFWEERNCNKAGETKYTNVCYQNLAIKNASGNGLTYITGPDTGKSVNTPIGNWTFVYLPTNFKFKATILNSDNVTSDVLYGACQFKPNEEAGATAYGAPYSLTNPPVNGWAALPGAGFTCQVLEAQDYAN